MIVEEKYIKANVPSLKESEYYTCPYESVKVGDYVIVHTDLGLEVAKVTDFINDSRYGDKQIERLATKGDLEKQVENEKESLAASKLFNDAVKKLNLNMRLVNSVYSLDRTKILFNYVSEERVDFRELLKMLSGTLHCRIELKQIGARDRSKIIGGVGICGLPLCCHSFLEEFEGISINMAKNQFLALNIQKLSGQCNKLLCCLKYEDDEYTRLKENAPRYGLKFRYDGIDYRVSGVNLLAKTVKIESSDKEIVRIISFAELDEMTKHA